MDVGGAWLRDLKPSQMLFATLNSGLFSGAKTDGGGRKHVKTAVLLSRKTKKGAHLSALLSRAVHMDLPIFLSISEPSELRPVNCRRDKFPALYVQIAMWRVEGDIAKQSGKTNNRNNTSSSILPTPAKNLIHVFRRSLV